VTAFLLGLLFNVKRIVGAFWTWATQSPARLIIIALIALSAFLAVSRASWQGEARKWKVRYTTEATAHITTKANYAQAQADAELLNKAEVARIENEYAAIAAKSERNYDALLADSRKSVAEFVRRQKAAQRVTQGTGTSSPATMPAETLPSPEEAVILVSDLEIAADNYSQLVSLIEWAESVGKVATE